MPLDLGQRSVPVISPIVAPPTETDTAHSPQATLAAPPSLIFTHIRNLSGIVSSLAAPHSWDDTPLPFMGTVAMGYLHSHGYNVSSVLHVAAAFQAAATSEEFAIILAHKGLPILEGRFLWELIQFNTPDSDTRMVSQYRYPTPSSLTVSETCRCRDVDTVHAMCTYQTDFATTTITAPLSFMQCNPE